VANNTVFNNVYGGVYVDGTSNMLVTNNIVVNNHNGDHRGVRTIGTGDRYLNNLVLNNGSGNMALASHRCSREPSSLNPQFVNYTGGVDGSYALKSTSPRAITEPAAGAPL